MSDPVVARRQLNNFVIPVEALSAAKRILDGTTYGKLKIVGEPSEYERFYRDVQLLAETVARLVTEST